MEGIRESNSEIASAALMMVMIVVASMVHLVLFSDFCLDKCGNDFLDAIEVARVTAWKLGA